MRCNSSNQMLDLACYQFAGIFRISLRLVWNVSVLCHHYWGCTRVMLASCLPSAPGPPLWGSTWKWASWFSSVPPWLAWALSVGCFQSLIQIFKIGQNIPISLVPILMLIFFPGLHSFYLHFQFFFCSGGFHNHLVWVGEMAYRVKYQLCKGPETEGSLDPDGQRVKAANARFRESDCRRWLPMHLYR